MTRCELLQKAFEQYQNSPVFERERWIKSEYDSYRDKMMN